jgi:hypothetical protein
MLQPCASGIAVTVAGGTFSKRQHGVDALVAAVVAGLEVATYVYRVHAPDAISAASSGALVMATTYLHAVRAFLLTGSLVRGDLVTAVCTAVTIALHLVVGYLLSDQPLRYATLVALLDPFVDLDTSLREADIHIVWTAALSRVTLIQCVAQLCQNSVLSWLHVAVPPRTRAFMEYIATKSKLPPRDKKQAAAADARSESTASNTLERTLPAMLEVAGVMYVARQRELFHFVEAVACFLKWFEATQDQVRISIDEGGVPPFWRWRDAAASNRGGGVGSTMPSAYHKICDSNPLTLRAWAAGLAFVELGMPLQSVAQGRLLLWFIELHSAHRAAMRFQAAWRMYRDIRRFELDRGRMDVMIGTEMRKRFRALKLRTAAKFFTHNSIHEAACQSPMVYVRHTQLRASYDVRIRGTHSTWKPPRTTVFHNPDPPVGGIWLNPEVGPANASFPSRYVRNGLDADAGGGGGDAARDHTTLEEDEVRHRKTTRDQEMRVDTGGLPAVDSEVGSPFGQQRREGYRNAAARASQNGGRAADDEDDETAPRPNLHNDDEDVS